MADVFTPAQRSALMAKIRSKDTKPERVVRSLLHRMGFRFRLHAKKLPGKPDIVLPRHRKAILVHGCFWHRHGVCRPLAVPKTNRAFWVAKFKGNVRRDAVKLAALTAAGWRVLVVWECETKDGARLERILRRFLRVKATAPRQPGNHARGSRRK